jgi:hypothetical protein
MTKAKKTVSENESETIEKDPEKKPAKTRKVSSKKTASAAESKAEKPKLTQDEIIDRIRSAAIKLNQMSEYRDVVMDATKAVLTHYYSTRTQYLFEMQDNGWGRSYHYNYKLDNSNAEKYVALHASCIPDSEISAVNTAGFANKVNKKLMACFPELELLHCLDPDKYQSGFLCHIRSIVNSCAHECRESTFSLEQILTLLGQNPLYRSLAERYLKKLEREKMAKATILKRIPENVIDLYPKARQIKRHFVLHIGPTNSGKTHDALEAFYAAESGVYLAPLRLLAYEIYDLSVKHGVPCSMLTGEERIIDAEAQHESDTIELLNPDKYYDVAVIDEAQMLGDTSRGWAWTAAILGVLAPVVHVCAAPEAEDILKQMIEQCGDTYEIFHTERDTPLIYDAEEFRFPESVQPKDALIVFSKKSVLYCAAALQKKGVRCSVIYGALPYEVRCSEVQRFINGQTSVVVSTDAIGMGMNLPIRRVVFLETKKFDGMDVRPLKPAEVKQIAGRAGRRGIYDEGLYTSEFGQKEIINAMTQENDKVRKAYLMFPRSLLSIDCELSSILMKWMEIPGSGIFEKADLSVKIALCRMMEQISNDKGLIYSFLTLSFDERDEYITNVFFDLFAMEVRGEHAEFQTPHYDNSIGSMEQAYKYCDLLYGYLTRFCTSAEAEKCLCVKKDIAGKIMNVLSQKKLAVRKCRICGRELPWNYPYPMCDSCHEMRYLQRDWGFEEGW